MKASSYSTLKAKRSKQNLESSNIVNVLINCENKKHISYDFGGIRFCISLNQNRTEETLLVERKPRLDYKKKRDGTKFNV